jgi:hypothetical protein
MNSQIIFISIQAALAVFSLVLAFWAGRMLPSAPDKWEKLPRNVLVGIIIAAADLAICVPLSKPLVPVWMISWLIPLAVICTWLSYQFLDYIFSRAFGGLLILLAHYLLFASFTFGTPVKPFVSILCFAMGTLGLFFCGKPYLMRDFIRKTALDKKWRITAVAISLIYAVTFAAVATFHLTKY